MHVHSHLMIRACHGLLTEIAWKFAGVQWRFQ